MATPGPVMRDISSGPLQDAPPSPARRPRRDEPFEPTSNARPLLLAHGGALTIDRLGTVAYEPTWELQDELAQQRRERRIGDRLLLLEHFPVFTIGRGGDASNLIASPQRLRELGATFDLSRFDHVARYDTTHDWIEMRLRSNGAHVVDVPGLGIEVPFADGEEMRTEISAKFRREVVEAELGAAGLELVSWWTDRGGDFALSLARK